MFLTAELVPPGLMSGEEDGWFEALTVDNGGCGGTTVETVAGTDLIELEIEDTRRLLELADPIAWFVWKTVSIWTVLTDGLEIVEEALDTLLAHGDHAQDIELRRTLTSCTSSRSERQFRCR